MGWMYIYGVLSKLCINWAYTAMNFSEYQWILMYNKYYHFRNIDLLILQPLLNPKNKADKFNLILIWFSSMAITEREDVVPWRLLKEPIYDHNPPLANTSLVMWLGLLIYWYSTPSSFNKSLRLINPYHYQHCIQTAKQTAAT